MNPVFGFMDTWSLVLHYPELVNGQKAVSTYKVDVDKNENDVNGIEFVQQTVDLSYGQSKQNMADFLTGASLLIGQKEMLGFATEMRNNADVLLEKYKGKEDQLAKVIAGAVQGLSSNGPSLVVGGVTGAAASSTGAGAVLAPIAPLLAQAFYDTMADVGKGYHEALKNGADNATAKKLAFCNGEKSLTEMVFNNLISNAVVRKLNLSAANKELLKDFITDRMKVIEQTTYDYFINPNEKISQLDFYDRMTGFCKNTLKGLVDPKGLPGIGVRKIISNRIQKKESRAFEAKKFDPHNVESSKNDLATNYLSDQKIKSRNITEVSPSKIDHNQKNIMGTSDTAWADSMSGGLLSLPSNSMNYWDREISNSNLAFNPRLIEAKMKSILYNTQGLNSSTENLTTFNGNLKPFDIFNSKKNKNQ